MFLQSRIRDCGVLLPFDLTVARQERKKQGESESGAWEGPGKTTSKPLTAQTDENFNVPGPNACPYPRGTLYNILAPL